MIREPLSGQDAVCPVSPETVMALASPRRVVDSLAHALDVSGEALGYNRVLQLPGYSVSVGEMAEALKRAGGAAAHARLKWQHDPASPDDWPEAWPESAVTAPRAEALGFRPDSGIDEAVRFFIEGRPRDAGRRQVASGVPLLRHPTAQAGIHDSNAGAVDEWVSGLRRDEGEEGGQPHYSRFINNLNL